MTKDFVPILLYSKELGRLCANGKFANKFNFKDLPDISQKVYRHQRASSNIASGNRKEDSKSQQSEQKKGEKSVFAKMED